MSKEQLPFSSLLNEKVYATGQVKCFEAGTVILNMDAYIRTIPIVISGSIRVMREDEEGQELLLYYIRPGESCILSILEGMNRQRSKLKAIVEEDAEIIMIDVEKTSEWLAQFPEWTRFIFDLYQKRFEELLEVVSTIAFQNLDARLLQLLRGKASLYQTNEISITHQQLAQEAGTTREAVSRVLKHMEKDGLIHLTRNKISLL
jgi:CRP/FNR family transcriptional regulator